MKIEYKNIENFSLIQWLKLIAINTLIAVILTLIEDGNFWLILFYSQSIGLSIAGLAFAIHCFMPNKKPSIYWFSAAIIVGVFIGINFAAFVTGNYQSTHADDAQKIFIDVFIYSSIIGCIVSYFFFLISKKKEYEKTLLENNLKILQAQIEPHFLFNTLSNVIGLIDNRPDDAKKMLEDFTHYLRSSLNRTRESDTTLGDEIAVVSAYLSIQKIRMGKRLNYKILITENLYDIAFPSLVIQPLVENSVRHGLESEIDGGDILIEVTSNKNWLTVEVVDTGRGANNLQSNGFGLNNIKERLNGIFQNKARIIVEENKPKGLKVTLQIPREDTCQ